MSVILQASSREFAFSGCCPEYRGGSGNITVCCIVRMAFSGRVSGACERGDICMENTVLYSVRSVFLGRY